MYSKQHLSTTQNITLKIKILILQVFSLLCFSMKLYANDIVTLPKLTLKPNQCVSLNQGQKCYVDINIDWQVMNTGEYCLYASHQRSALKCWANVSTGNFQQSLVLEDDIKFTLRVKGDDKFIIATKLELAWVHKKSRLSHSSWRVF